MNVQLTLLSILLGVFLLLFTPYLSLYLYTYTGCEKRFIATLKTMQQFLKMVSNVKRVYAKEYHVKIFPLNSGDIPGLINMGTSFSKAPVVFKPVWGYHFARNPEVFSIAFIHSVGHELGHWTDIKKGSKFNKRPTEEKEFFLWVREIRNDFEGISILERYYPNITRNQIIDAIECKANAPVIDLKPKKKKEKQNRQSGSYRDHPEWDFRLQIIKCGQFSEEVIKKIADKAECTNADYVQEVVRMYFCE